MSKEGYKATIYTKLKLSTELSKASKGRHSIWVKDYSGRNPIHKEPYKPVKA